MWVPFRSFPYNKNVWVLSINQLHDLNNAVVYTGQDVDSIDLTGYDFSQVTDLILSTGVNELNCRGNHTEYLQQTITNCHSKFVNLKNIYLFYTTVYFEEDKLISSCPITTIHLPYFLLRSTMTDLSQFSQWTPYNKKAILLTGDIRNRPHRFPLLYYFLINNNLDLLNYSLSNKHYGSDYFTENHMGMVVFWINQMFDADLDLQSFEKLYNNLKYSFEDDSEFIDRFGKVHNFTGLSIFTHYYPKNVWNDSTCNVVTETAFSETRHYIGVMYDNGKDPFFFSEKIWKPILAGKPFVIISENDSAYKELEKMGFRTFLKYTDHPNITISENPKYSELTKKQIHSDFLKKHIQICYDRTLSFLYNAERYKDEILNDIEFNITKWKEVSNNAWEEVYSKCPPCRTMTQDTFCEMFNNNGADLKFFADWASK